MWRFSEATLYQFFIQNLCTCNAENCAAEQLPTGRGVCAEKKDDVMRGQGFEYGRLVVHDRIDTDEGSSESPGSHDWWEEETHSGGSVLLQHE